jgi:hypothetical protein
LWYGGEPELVQASYNQHFCVHKCWLVWEVPDAYRTLFAVLYVVFLLFGEISKEGKKEKEKCLSSGRVSRWQFPGLMDVMCYNRLIKGWLLYIMFTLCIGCNLVGKKKPDYPVLTTMNLKYSFGLLRP